YIAVLLSGIAKREKARRGLERLIDERDVLLSIDTPIKLLEQLRERLLRVVPQLSEVSFLVSTGNAEAPFAPVVVQSGTAASAAPGPDLINLAQSSQVNTFARREALLRLSSPDVPADVVYCRSRRTLDPVDQRILDILARNLDIECENQKAIRMTSSLETARQIQEAMLPTNFPEVGEVLGIDLFALVRPATEVGGDLYDFYKLDEHRICIVVGDVSGKGVPAAMFMAMTRTLIRAAIEAGQNPLDAVAQANASLAAENPQMMFVTLFFGLYDRRTGRLDCVNAGHNPPLIIGHDGSIRELAVKPNVALGLIEAAEFEAQSFDISNDDTLFLYTDGVT
ncbi:MAG: PP2C family protein-serine/threonine phosphatase, partial [Hyphomicrobiales bacterium]|nr:PP2C family protein-serine/threonine phosphatase [Hyphomicrobiales bacterium]